MTPVREPWPLVFMGFIRQFSVSVPLEASCSPPHAHPRSLGPPSLVRTRLSSVLSYPLISWQQHLLLHSRENLSLFCRVVRCLFANFSRTLQIQTEDLRAGGAIAADNKFPSAREINFEGSAFWLDSLTLPLLFGCKAIPILVSLTFKGAERGKGAEQCLMKEFCIGKTLTFEMFSVISRTGSFRQRSLR